MQIYTKDNLNTYVSEHLTPLSNEALVLSELHRYVTAPNNRKVFGLLGSRTMMLLQEISRLNDYENTVFVDCEAGDDMLDLKSAVFKTLWNEVDIKRYPSGGSCIVSKDGRTDVRFVFIDNITAISSFTEQCSFLADSIAITGVKVVISGQDENALYKAKQYELYDRITLM